MSFFAKLFESFPEMLPALFLHFCKSLNDGDVSDRQQIVRIESLTSQNGCE